jgi:phosphoribosylamine-glycine ligase
MEFYKGLFYRIDQCQNEPIVIEYNEWAIQRQVVIPRLKTDLVELFFAANEKLDEIIWKLTKEGATVMVVSGGYPGF